MSLDAVIDRGRLTVLRLEFGRSRQDIGHGRERILPQTSLHILHAGALGDDGLAGRRPTALQRKLMRHKVCAGCRQQEPDKAVAPDIRGRLLCVGCHGHSPGPQRRFLEPDRMDEGPDTMRFASGLPPRSGTTSVHQGTSAASSYDRCKLRQSDSTYSSTLILAYPGRLASADGASSTSGAPSILPLARLSQSCSKILAKYSASFASSNSRLASRFSEIPCSDQFWLPMRRRWRSTITPLVSQFFWTRMSAISKPKSCNPSRLARASAWFRMRKMMRTFTPAFCFASTADSSSLSLF